MSHFLNALTAKTTAKKISIMSKKLLISFFKHGGLYGVLHVIHKLVHWHGICEVLVIHVNKQFNKKIYHFQIPMPILTNARGSQLFWETTHLIMVNVTDSEV